MTPEPGAGEQKHSPLLISSWNQVLTGEYNLTLPNDDVVAVVYDYDHAVQIIEALQAAVERTALRERVAELEAAMWSWRGLLVDAKTVARYWSPPRREWIEQMADGNGIQEEIMHLGFDLIIKITEALAAAAGESGVSE